MSLALFLIAAIAAPAQEAERPMPDLSAFLGEVRKHLRSDRLLLSQYTYTETQTEHHLDKSGKIKKTESTVAEV